jgi:hypothetical protein
MYKVSMASLVLMVISGIGIMIYMVQGKMWAAWGCVGLVALFMGLVILANSRLFDKR